MLSDNVIIELYQLSRNMNWLNGCALIWHWNGYGFKPWWNQIRLSFCEFYFWHEGERVDETLDEWAAKRELENHHKTVIEWPLS